MKPIHPGTGAQEVTVAEDQPEYIKYPAALYQTKEGTLCLLSRWTFTDEEREMIARGEDLFVGILTGGRPVQPVIFQVGPEGWELPRPTEYVCPKCHEAFALVEDAREHMRGCRKEIREEYKT